jgi:hypothetical protein
MPPPRTLALAAGLAALTLAGAACSSGAGTGPSIGSVASSSTSTTLAGLGPALRVPDTEPASLGRLFQAWTLQVEGDGYIGPCAADVQAMDPAHTWCSISVGNVVPEGETFWLAHPGSAGPEAAVLIGPRDGAYAIVDSYALGGASTEPPPSWLGSPG